MKKIEGILSRTGNASIFSKGRSICPPVPEGFSALGPSKSLTNGKGSASILLRKSRQNTTSLTKKTVLQQLVGKSAW